MPPTSNGVRPRSHRRPADKFLTPSECRSQGVDFMDQLKLKGTGLKRHRQRVSIFTTEYAKLDVKQDSVMEMCWGNVPLELVELIASHLHPGDVARMRSVSSGWRAAFWQERVVRASLCTCGRLVHYEFLLKMLDGAGIEVTSAIFDKRYADESVCWRYVLGKMCWSDYVRKETEVLTLRICLAVVPLGTSNTHAQLFALNDIPRKIRRHV